MSNDPDFSLDDFSLDTARSAAGRGELDSWVSDFLSSPGSDNAALAESLTSTGHEWLGPTLVPLDRLHRLAGPPGARALAPFDDDDLETVDAMEESLEDGWQPPPLIVSFRDRQLVVEDGTHRVEGLRRAGQRVGWALVHLADPADQHALAEEFGIGVAG